MSRQILAANLLRFKELENLLEGLGPIPAMLLKGGALVLAGCRGFAERPMSDLDLLIHPEDWGPAQRALEKLGYVKIADDPSEYRKGDCIFDLHDGIWYLDAKETRALWSRARLLPLGGGTAACGTNVYGTAACGTDACGKPSRVPSAGQSGVFIPAPEDLLIHVLAHAAVHHGEADPVWAGDVRAILDAHSGARNGAHNGADPQGGAILRDRVRKELERLGLLPAVNWFLARTASAPELGLGRFPGWLDRLDFPYKGHALRLIFLRGWGFRLGYLKRAIFPDAAFLARRYDLRSGRRVLLWRFFRPVRLGLGACVLMLRFVRSGFESAIRRLREPA